MSLDERIKTLARQVAAETGPAADLTQVLARLDELHTELHAVATRVTALEKAAAPSAVDTGQPEPDAAPRASRPRKATGA